MNRRNFLTASGAIFGSLLLPKDSFGSTFNFPADYNFQLLRKKVGIFTERGGTIAWMLSKKGIVVVDTQFPEQSQHLIEEIRKNSDRKIDLLINTHHHGDHTAGNIAFKDIAEKIVAHKNSKINQQKSAAARGTEDQQLYPDTLFETSWSQKVGSERISATYFGAAHTNGDSVIHFKKANVAHLGDLIFNRRFPYIDRPAGASIDNWINVLDKILKKFNKKTLFVFGHAGDGYDVTGGKEDIKAMINYLEKLLEFVGKEKKAGKSLEELLKSVTTIPGAPEWKGGGIERNLTAAFEELSM